MAIVINGSGTVTGLAVGGLPDGTVDAGTLATDSVVTGKIADGTIANADIADLAASKLTGALPAISGASLTGISGSSDYRPSASPIIINGAMNVAQRGTSFAHPDSNGNNFTVDRFNINTGAIGVYTSTQESLTSGAAFNAGFKKAARIDCTTAQASPASGDYFYAEYKIEAQDCSAFKKGTSAAETMTVAFWVKSNKTGTSQLTVKDGDNDRICAGTYAISVANTWEHKVINIAADTTGAFNNDSGAGYIFEWWLGGGSTYTSGTAPTSWEARADGDRGANNLAINDSTANDWAITGLQVEVGTYTAATLPPFQHECYGDNLARCQRYFFKTQPQSVAADTWSWGGGLTIAPNTGNRQTGGTFPVTMRASATVTVLSTDSSTGKVYVGGSHVAASIPDSGENGFRLSVSGGVSTSADAAMCFYADAEL